jgi:hypothetical protein
MPRPKTSSKETPKTIESSMTRTKNLTIRTKIETLTRDTKTTGMPIQKTILSLKPRLKPLLMKSKDQVIRILARMSDKSNYLWIINFRDFLNIIYFIIICLIFTQKKGIPRK